jgi:hypothetical protein
MERDLGVVNNFVHIPFIFVVVEKQNSFIFVRQKIQGMEKEQLINELEELQGKLTGDMFQDMEIKDQIHNLEMKINGVKPMDTHIDCVGCGS